MEESTFSPHVRVHPQILLVDDDSVFRMALGAAMRQWGFVVHEAENASLAFAAAQTTAIDLAVLDIHLPDETGIALARRLRHMPVLFVTHDEDRGLVERTYDDRVLRRQIVGYVLKPFEVDRFEPTIRTAVLLAQELRRQRDVLLASTRAGERERMAIARDLTERLLPALTALQEEGAALFREAPSAPDAAFGGGRERILGLVVLAETIARQLITRLSPDPLQSTDLTSACLLLAQRYAELQPHASCVMRFSGNAGTVAREMSGLVYRLTSDLLDLVRLHLHPSSVSVLVSFPAPPGPSAPEMRITVRHDGHAGIQQQHSPAREAFGLLTDEVTRMGGYVNVTEAPPANTITVHLPADLLMASPRAAAAHG